MAENESQIRHNQEKLTFLRIDKQMSRTKRAYVGGDRESPGKILL